MTSPSSEFCGIDPAAMNAMAADLRQAADRLTAFSTDFEGLFRANGVSTAPLSQITAIADWGRKQAPMLSERAELIKALNGTGDNTFARLPDALDSFATGRALATTYGTGILANSDFSAETKADLVHQHIKELAALAKDPAAAAAFFATLHPKVRDLLPTLLITTGSPTAKQDLAAFSAALGAALRAPSGIPAFEKVKAELVSKPSNRSMAWNRLALLAGAKAPTDVRVAAARNLALDDFMKNPRQSWTGASIDETRTYGYSPDTVALALEMLAGDGKAARAAFAQMGGEGVKLTRVEKMKQFLSYAKTYGTGVDVADAFGRVLATASGAYDEKDGAHSVEAAKFAFDVIREMPKLGVPTPMRLSMAEIAGSYATEFTEGANLSDANRTQPSAFGPVKTIVPGLNPMFRLSPKDTYEFVKTFADSARNIKPFEEGMGNLTDRIVKAAAKMDNGKSVDHLERAMRALGYVAGMQFATEREVQGKLDAEDQARVKAEMFAYGLALGGAGLLIPGMIGQALWVAVSSLTPLGVEAMITPDKSRVSELNDRDRAAWMARETWLANILMSNGFKARVAPDDPRFSNAPITGADGKLLPYSEIAKNKEAVRNFDNWLIANGSGGTSEIQFGEVQASLEERFAGARKVAETRGPSPYE
ncbi:hypothetical protein GCM10010116_32230 [Microbispora rosea subsp. aerata]|nr:hypothetical protein [Microbispora rosea]GGO16004.1 hypothetical protein GCM10010116_32230 [Microbispora rosea subsp. aerata]GIH55827.1 hypothetical protein Mro02_27410 [Microbispora rosea subsp. aerata]GLJ83259.1 hypothetical protein GCM10017588_19860 [Microbispora rosea subsp. aerata]